jgi:small subunit ribosomal protein S13
MPRVAGVDIPAAKKVKIALTYIYGIGRKNAMGILKEVNVDPERRAKDLSEDELSRLAAQIDKNYVIEGQLRRQVAQNIARLKDIRCRRGFRHMRGLPVRGQRTKTNARTRKGPTRTMAGKRSVKDKVSRG